MHAVLNHLHFSQDVDADLFAAAETDLVPRMRAIEGFRGFHVVQTSPTDVTLVIFAVDAETLDRIATEVGSPWMRANVLPLLAAPPDRNLGPVLTSS
jgi:hypothetical protein